METDEDIATKFVCFIRHSKNLRKPKIYSVKIENRDTGKFNFEKNKELKGDVKQIIKERNKFIKEGNGKRDPSNYFLIIEANIPLFHGENEKYASYIEFLDFPGLDEVKSWDDDSIKDNTYFKDFIPLVQPNIMFSLFLFDLNSYESTSGKEIFKLYISNKDEYISTKLKESLHNSIYILNQIDKELKQEKDKNKREIIKEKKEEHFRNKMIENFEKVIDIKNVIFNEQNSISISAKILELEEYKLDSFPQFIEYIISLEDIEEEKNFKMYLEKKMKEILELSKIDKPKKYKGDIDEDLQDEVDNVNELLDQVHLVGNKFKLEEYNYYQKLFIKKSKKLKDFEEKKEIQLLIINNIKKVFDNFFDLNEFSNILTYIENNSKELIEYSKKINRNLNLLTKNPNSIEHPLNLLETLFEKLQNFKLINKESKTINTLIHKENIVLNYIKNQLSIRILFIGRHSSGKTSLINSFLGIDLLETSSEECTMNGFIIKYIDDFEEISIYNAEMIKNNFGYFYFEKNNLIVKGIKQVKEEIAKINKNKKIKKSKSDDTKTKFNYYIVEVPINMYKIAKFDKQIYSKIELIDIPGLDTGYEEAIQASSKLLDFTDGFIFANNGKQLDNNDNRTIIKNIIERISKRNEFSFNSC